MARRRNGSSNPISLFPFLSVLSCVIGTLALMISVVALTGIVDDPIYRANTHKRLQRELVDVNKDNKRLMKSIKKKNDAQEQMAEVTNRIASLRVQIEAQGNTHDQYKSMSQQLARVEDNITRQQHEKVRIMNLRSTLEMELKKRRKEHPKGMEFTPVQILPSGRRKTQEQVWYAVCGRAFVTLYENGVQLANIRSQNIQESTRFKRFLGDIRRAKDGLLIFLIRMDGVHIFNTASKMARVQKIKFGKLAVPWRGQIDLSVFGKRTSRSD